MSTEGQLTPGELDVIRINKERQAAMDRGEITNDKRHLLRGMGALAHIEKVNREKGVETPSHIHEEHKQAHEEHHREMAGRKRTPGEEELERENARRQAEIDAGQADYRHLLHGVSAFNFIEKINREHGITEPIPMPHDPHKKDYAHHSVSVEAGPGESTGLAGSAVHGAQSTGASGFGSSEITKDIAGKSTISEDRPLEEVPAQFGGKKLVGAAKYSHEAKLAREREQAERKGMEE